MKEKKGVTRDVRRGISLGIVAVLLLLVTLASLQAAPQGLSSLTVKGRDGIKGYVRSNIDFFTFSVIAKNGDQNIAPEQVRLGGTSSNGGFAFESCISSSDGYECKLARNMTGFLICPKTTFDVNLYDPNGNFIDDEQATVLCDTAAPSVTASVDKAKYSSQDTVAISYSVQDTAYSSSSAFECSGIKNTITVSSGSFSKAYTITPGNGCSYSGTITESATVFNTGTNVSSVTLNVTGFDAFGQGGSAYPHFDTDFQGLSFILAYVNVTDTNHKDIAYFLPMQVLVEFAVDVLEPDFDESSLEADLSEFGITSAEYGCFDIDGRKRCAWSNIPLSLQEPSLSRIITVSGKDSTGNKKTTVLSLVKSLPVDKKAPRIANLNVQKQGKVFNVTNPGTHQVSISVDILEPETGLETITVKADLSALNSFANYKNLAKDYCTPLKENLTRCTWNNVNARLDVQGLNHKSLAFTAGDKSGNNITENLPYSVFVDAEPPVPLQLYVEGQEPETVNYISPKGSTFVLVLQEIGMGLDESHVMLDASAITGNPNLAADRCVQQGDIFTCYWNKLGSSFTDRRAISSSLLIQDKVGNKAASSLSLELEIDEGNPAINEIKQIPQYPAYTDKIFFEVKAADTVSGVKRAVLYPGSIVNATELGMECRSATDNETNRNDVTCHLELTGLPAKAQSDKVKILVEDFAGNTAERVLLLEIAEPDARRTPDFLTVKSTGITPTKVPRKATSQVPFSMFGKVSLGTKENVQILSMSADCSSEYAERGSTYIINEGTIDPVIAFRLTSEVGNVAANEITIPCKLSMTVKRGSTIFSKPEVEAIELKIPLYDAPTGVADANVQAKLNEIDKDIKDLGKEIEAKEKFASILATWCTISKLMGQLNSVLQNVKLLWYTVTNFQEINAISQISTSMSAGTAAFTAAIPAASAGCSAVVTSTVCCPVKAKLIALEIGVTEGVAEYNALSSTGNILAAKSADTVAGIFATASASTAACPTTAGFSPALATSASTIVAGTAVWNSAKTSFMSICTKFGWFHSFVDKFIWPPGPFGLGGAATAAAGGVSGAASSAVSGNPAAALSLIGMINKMGCAISYQCALCDWEDWIDVGFDALDKAFGKHIKGTVANFFGTGTGADVTDTSTKTAVGKGDKIIVDGREGNIVQVTAGEKVGEKPGVWVYTVDVGGGESIILKSYETYRYSPIGTPSAPVTQSPSSVGGSSPPPPESQEQKPFTGRLSENEDGSGWSKSIAPATKEEQEAYQGYKTPKEGGLVVPASYQEGGVEQTDFSGSGWSPNYDGATSPQADLVDYYKSIATYHRVDKNDNFMAITEDNKLILIPSDDRSLVYVASQTDRGLEWQVARGDEIRSIPEDQLPARLRDISQSSTNILTTPPTPPLGDTDPYNLIETFSPSPPQNVDLGYPRFAQGIIDDIATNVDKNLAYQAWDERGSYYAVDVLSGERIYIPNAGDERGFFVYSSRQIDGVWYWYETSNGINWKLAENPLALNLFVTGDQPTITPPPSTPPPPSGPISTVIYSGFPFTGQAAGPPDVPGVGDYKPPQVTYRPDNNGWRNSIVETEAPEELKSATWIWNPYKSKPYAYACMCYPPIIYNLKKERQIKCMYRNCLQHELTSGVTTTACDLAYKERQCLYVDGAQFKLFDNENAMGNLINAISQKLPFLIGGLIYQSVCGAYSITGGPEYCQQAFTTFIATAGKYPTACGIVGTVQTLLELKGVWDTLYGGFSYDKSALNGPDYCATAGYPDERRDY
ncbi:hypothetical protein HYV81_01335 [Candidatus Woesearchaeota archaeon]|nr:hypothetical protein [Candidatus Woesearchaeota archaeon]